MEKRNEDQIELKETLISLQCLGVLSAEFLCHILVNFDVVLQAEFQGFDCLHTSHVQVHRFVVLFNVHKHGHLK